MLLQYNKCTFINEGLKSTVYRCLSLIVGIIYFGSCYSTAPSGDEVFTIRHVGLGRCLVAEPLQVGVAECTGSPAEQWKWGSGHRLFHIATALCLGIEENSAVPRLLSCGSMGGTLSWECSGEVVHTAQPLLLLVRNGTAWAGHTNSDPPDRWTRDGSPDSICRRSLQVVHTTLGNSFSKPCHFPFLFNGTWHHECLPDEQLEGLSWCSTTLDYDTDRKLGYCLKPETGCRVLWENSGRGRCYQRNLQSALTWYEARLSCRSQGGDLLSFSNTQELNHLVVKGDYPAQVWIGLNQLDLSQGWQWSDKSPLAFVNWKEGMPTMSRLKEVDCAVMTTQGFWESTTCSKRLPYICQKELNQTGSEPTSSWVYKATTCESGWMPGNGFCYQLVQDQLRPMQEAQQYCEAAGGGLISMHSLADVEMIDTMFKSLPAGASHVWTGLKSEKNPIIFQWMDQTPVSFTYWARDEPQLGSENVTCVSFSKKTHLWNVNPCGTSLPFMCKKKGDVNDTGVDPGCPVDGDWKRHGNACYRVDTKEVGFKERCNLSIMNRFEQAFINSLIGLNITAEKQFFWTDLQDMKSTGEYQWVSTEGATVRMTFDNWNLFEPAAAGGCVVMSSQPLGKWEVKNCTTFRAASVCKTEVGPHVAPEPESDLGLPCPPGWVSGSNIHNCYKVFHGERLSRKRSWEEAERFCQALGAHLPSFSHVDEMKALHFIMRDVISDDRYFWVGLNRRNPSLGNTWQWSDGRPVSTTIFPKEFHEDDEYSRDCLAFKTQRLSLKALLIYLFHDFPTRSFYARPFHCDAQLEWVCQIQRGKTLETPEWYNPSGHHESSVFIDGHEFWFMNETKLTYDEARLYCSQNGSKLAMPMNLNAAEKIFEEVSKSSQSMQSWWLDMQEPSQLFSMRLSERLYYHTGLLGRCFSLSPQSIFPELERSCEQRLPFVCERLNATWVEKRAPEPGPVGLPCENGSLTFQNKCYTVFRPLYQSFKQASEHCHSLRGTLLTISSQVEQDFVTAGLPDQPKKSWIGLKLKLQEMQWVDGSPVTFLNFNPLLLGQLRPLLINNFDPDSMEMCAYMFNDHSALTGTWDYIPCANQRYFSVCQHYADKPEEPYVPEGEFRVGNHSYWVLQGNMTWPEALERCRTKGMDLVSMSDAYQQSGLTVTVSRFGRPLWIGLFSDDDGLHYRWTDQSHTVFSRWSPEPTAGDCVYLDTDGFWKATECEEELGGAICHMPPNVTDVVPYIATSVCPHRGSGPNWIPFRNNCYTFQLASSRWDDIDRGDFYSTCKKLDHRADILTIRDGAENEFVRQQLLPFRDLVQFVWLGVFKDRHVQTMKWYDGTNVQYSNWKGGRPNITEPFMAGLNLNGIWELFINQRTFMPFKERSIVACKIENDSKEEFQKSVRDSERFGDLSYHVIEGRTTWFDAVRACAMVNSHLASIHDSAHDAHLEMISRRDGFPLWIGLSNQDVSSSFFEWSDGTRYDYRPREFSNSHTEGDCVFMSPTGSWGQADCFSVQEGAICYNGSVERSSSRSIPESSDCPGDRGASKWIREKERCYAFDMAFFNYTVYSMEEARSVCGSLDATAQMLTIEDKEENDFVSAYLSGNPLITSRVWLGMDLNMQGEPVSWMDGTSLEFFNWEEGGSAWTTAGAICAVMVPNKGGTWSRVSCQDSRSRIVCEAPIRSGSSPLALVFFLIVVAVLVGAVGFIIYRRNRTRFSSTVRYKRNFDEADSTSIITQTE